MSENFFAREVDGHYQNLVDHLKNVGNGMAERVPELFKAIAYSIGVLHDLGKYNSQWQLYLKGKSKKVNHSAQGAFAATIFNNVQESDACLPILGHHSTLKNYGQITQDYVKKKGGWPIEEIKRFRAQVNETFSKENLNTDIPELDKYLAVKMLYSALVDADSLDSKYTSNIEIAANGAILWKGNYCNNVGCLNSN